MTQMQNDSTQYSEKLAALKSLMDELAKGMFPDKDSKFIDDLQINPNFVPPNAWAYTPEKLVRYLYVQLNDGQLSEKDRVDCFINFISYRSNYTWLKSTVGDNPLISETNKKNLHAAIDDMKNFNEPNRTPNARIQDVAPPQTIKETLSLGETIRNFFKNLFLKKDEVESDYSIHDLYYGDPPSDLNTVHTPDVPSPKVSFADRVRNFFTGFFKEEPTDEDKDNNCDSLRQFGKLGTPKKIEPNLEYEEPQRTKKQPLNKNALLEVIPRTNEPNTDKNNAPTHPRS